LDEFLDDSKIRYLNQCHRISLGLLKLVILVSILGCSVIVVQSVIKLLVERLLVAVLEGKTRDRFSLTS
jgi:hypothetical protein